VTGSPRRSDSDGARGTNARRRDPAFDQAGLREHLGAHRAEDQTAYLDPDELDRAAGPTDTAVYEGDLEAEGGLVESDADQRSFESLTERELRSGETDDPSEAAEEGLTYVAPTDPPVVPGEEGEPEVAAGFGSSALDDEPYDADHHSELVTEDDEVSERVREALRADATTTTYADTLDVETDGRMVVVRGAVADIDDADNVLAVAERVAGVSQVVDELEVAGIS
jgi:hypothetical protein